MHVFSCGHYNKSVQLLGRLTLDVSSRTGDMGIIDVSELAVLFTNMESFTLLGLTCNDLGRLSLLLSRDYPHDTWYGG